MNRASVAMTTATAAGTAFLLPVAINPASHTVFWSPKMAVLLLGGIVGLTTLAGRRSRQRDAAAVAAIAFLCLAGLSTVLADNPLLALLGSYRWGNGMLLLTSGVGLWSLGRSVPSGEREIVAAALLVGIGVSSAIAVLQALDLVTAPALRSPTRVSGLTGNAGRLAMLSTATVAFSVRRVGSDLRFLWVAAAGAFVTQLTGTRAALLVVLALVVAGLVRLPWRRGLAAAGALASGLLLGDRMTALTDVVTASGRSAATAGGLATPSGNVRLEVWSYARHAILDQPLLGAGPGRFLAATGPDRTLTVARSEGPEVLYGDAHNFVVEHLVTIGVLGTVALLSWLLLATRRGRGPWLWFAGAMFAMALLQPIEPGSTPLMFLALGLSSTSVHHHRRRLPTAAIPAGAMACLLAGGLLAGDVLLERADDGRQVRVAETSASLLWPWPEPASLVAAIHSARWLDGDGSLETALEWRRRAVHRDESHPGSWALLGLVQEAAGRCGAAELSFRAALGRNPWSVLALRHLADLAGARSADEDARALRRRADLVEASADDGEAEGSCRP